jgi:hypothetical protein
VRKLRIHLTYRMLGKSNENEHDEEDYMTMTQSLREDPYHNTAMKRMQLISRLRAE